MQNDQKNSEITQNFFFNSEMNFCETEQFKHNNMLNFMRRYAYNP